VQEYNENFINDNSSKFFDEDKKNEKNLNVLMKN
jgi:hypothetical protein